LAAAHSEGITRFIGAPMADYLQSGFDRKTWTKQ
jgi:hypothetical protein